MHVAVTVGAVFNFSALEFANRFTNILGHGSGLGVRHETTWSEHSTDTTHQRHHVGSSNGQVEIENTFFDFGSEVVGTNNVGTSLTSFFGSFTGCENCNANVLTGT